MKRKVWLRPRVVDGVDCASPEITLWVRGRFGAFAPIRFVVDTGADLPGMTIALAQEENIPFLRNEATRGRASGLVGGVEKFLGTIHVRVADEDFDWPCNFLGEPASPVRSSRKYAVLGRGGFLAAFNIAIERPYLTLERRMNHRPLWYRLARTAFPRWAVEHPAGVSL